MTVLLTLVLIGSGAFAIDFGMAYWNKRQLSIAADAAALAAARSIALDAQTCAAVDSYESTARGIAADYVAGNKPADGTALADFSAACTSDGTYVRVEVDTSRTAPGILSGIFGIDAFSLAGHATAAVGPPGEISGLRPYAICEAAATPLDTAPGTTAVVSFDNNTGLCPGGPGNWGVMDFNGGSNPTGETEQWTQYGYGDPIPVPTPPAHLTFPGNPGAPGPGALADEMNSIVDETIIIPVFSTVTGNGSNSTFTITRFMGVKVCGWNFQNQSGHGSCWDDSLVPTPEPQNYMQIQKVNEIAVGEINTVIGYDDPAYQGLRVVSLVE